MSGFTSRELQERSCSHWIFVINIKSLADRFQCDRSYLSISIPSTPSCNGCSMSRDRVQVGVSAYQVLREFVNGLPRCRVSTGHDPRLFIGRPHHLFSINLNSITPDLMIPSKILVQLRWFAVMSAQAPTTTHLTSIHSCQFIGRTLIVTL